ncbi:hypothetical protein EAE96_000170 [Botrytis aclada]|nr:hypothetical protein EAE96_000170 [Botrytis aclada]
MAELGKVCSALSSRVQIEESGKKPKTTPVECSSDLQMREDSGWFRDLSENEGVETEAFQGAEEGESREMSSRRGYYSRKNQLKRSHSRLRDLSEGTCKEIIDQGTKVYKDAFDLCWDDTIEENKKVLRNMCNMEVNIAEYVEWSLPGFLWMQLENNYSKTLKLSALLWKYWGENDKMDDCYPIECEVLKHLNSETLSFCATTKRPIDVETVEISMLPMDNERLKKSGSLISIETAKTSWSCSTAAALPPTPQIEMKGSQIYVFVAALKYFISKCLGSDNGLTPYTFCTLNLFLASSNANRDKACNYAENVQEGKTKSPLYVISRLYLEFIAKRCFGEQTRPMGMILLQTFAMKWMHYMTLPFDEDDWEFQEVMCNLSDMPIMDLTDYLEKVLRKRVYGIIQHSMEGSIPVKGSNSVTYTPENKLSPKLREVSTRPDIITPPESIKSDDDGPSPLIAQETPLNETNPPLIELLTGTLKKSIQDSSFYSNEKWEVYEECIEFVDEGVD